MSDVRKESEFFHDDFDRNKKQSSTTIEARDKFHLCSIFAILFGICSLLPWNCLLISNMFFESKIDDGTNLTKIYASTFTSCANITVVISFLINIFYLYRFKTSKRATVSFFMILLGFALLTSFISVDTTKFARVFFAIVILTSVFLSFASTTNQHAFFVIFGSFPSNYLNLFFTGQALSGLFAVCLQLIVIVTGLPPNMSPYLFFVTVLIFIGLAIASYAIFIKLNYYKHYMVKSPKIEAENYISEERIKPNFRQVLFIYWRVLSKVITHASTIFVTFFVTLFLFPVLSLKWTSTSDNTIWSKKYFTTVVVFLMFNIGDTVGRIITRYISWPKGNSVWLPVLAMSRILFFFPFLMCNISSNEQYTLFPVVFKHDAFPAVFMFLFAFTNGYFPSVAISSSFEYVNPEEVEYCHSLLVFLIGVGLSCGSFLSFFL